MLMIPGPDGVLEARYHASSMQGSSASVLIVPPHPQHEGDMSHPVISTLFRAFASLQLNVLSFNFRGSGHSQGRFVDNDGEVADAAAALDWLRAKNTACHQFWVAGFSFGAYVAMQLLMRRPECSGFVVVNPLVNLYDFNFLAPCPTEGLLVHSDNSIVPKEAVVRMAHQLSMQKRGRMTVLRHVPQGDHEFTQHLHELHTVVTSYMKDRLHAATHVMREGVAV